jgi:hypothetical protein
LNVNGCAFANAASPHTQVPPTPFGYIFIVDGVPMSQARARGAHAWLLLMMMLLRPAFALEGPRCALGPKHTICFNACHVMAPAAAGPYVHVHLSVSSIRAAQEDEMRSHRFSPLGSNIVEDATTAETGRACA